MDPAPNDLSESVNFTALHPSVPEESSSTADQPSELPPPPPSSPPLFSDHGQLVYVNTALLDEIDISQTYVTVDSNRVNRTFEQLFHSLRTLLTSVSTLSAEVTKQHKEIGGLQNENAHLRGALQEVMTRTGNQEVAVVSLSNQLKHEVEKGNEIAERLTTQEVYASELHEASESITNLEAIVEECRNGTSESDRRMAEAEVRLQSHEDVLKEVSANAQSAAERANFLYAMLEIDPVAATAAAEQWKHDHTIIDGLSPQCGFVHELSSFVALKRLFQNGLDDLSERNLTTLKATREDFLKQLELLLDKLTGKVDIVDFEPFQDNVRNRLRRYEAVFSLLDNLPDELDKKANCRDLEALQVKLENKKADRAEFIDILRREDVEDLEEKMEAVENAFDSLLSKLSLEIQGMKRGGGESSLSAVEAASATGTSESDRVMFLRLARLEHDSQMLFRNKADRTELVDLIRAFREDNGTPEGDEKYDHSALSRVLSQLDAGTKLPAVHQRQIHSAPQHDTTGREEAAVGTGTQRSHQGSSVSMGTLPAIRESQTRIRRISPNPQGGRHTRYGSGAIFRDSSGTELAGVSGRCATGPTEYWANMLKWDRTIDDIVKTE